MIVQVVDQVRGPGIGASMAAACLGVSPYLSPIGAFLQLTGRATSTSNRFSRWGQILEPIIRGDYAARHRYDRPREVEIFVPASSLYHPEYPWLRATPDGIVREWITTFTAADGTEVGYFDRHLVQVKCVDARIAWHWGLGKVKSAPAHYRIQAVVEMAVTGLPRNDFAVLCGGNDDWEVIVERDLDLESAVIARLAQFWDALQRDEPPAIDESEDWRAYFADRLPKEKAPMVADHNAEAWIEEWKRARETREQAERDEETAKNHLLAIAVAGNATSINSDHGPILVVRSSNKPPYLKAPSSWAIDKDVQ